jgi:hypothetical protein
LCDLLDLPRPEPSVADEAANTCVFDKAVSFPLPDGKTITKYICLSGRPEVPIAVFG